jgi:secondary thiamine-phosphate synthase enzyme
MVNQVVYEAFEVVASEVVFVTHRLSVRTRSKVEFQNITRAVQEVVVSSRIENGVCYVFVPHTTAAVTLNEQADPSVVEDIAEQLESIVPQQGNYHHSEGNSPAHIKASLFGSSAMVMVDDGRLVLGTWQGIFFCEFDGPRNRSMLVKILPDNR